MWRVCFGLYPITRVDVKLTITIETEVEKNISKIGTNIDASKNFSPAPRTASLLPHSAASKVSAAASPLRRRTPLSSTTAPIIQEWFRGELHMHTVHSDGTWKFAELYDVACAGKLDFISVTDHNIASHHREIDELFAANADRRPVVTRGEEITIHNGHANAWGLPSGTWLDFRVRAGNEQRMKAIVADAHARLALVSINHPTARCQDCDWSYTTDGYDAIEV